MGPHSLTGGAPSTILVQRFGAAWLTDALHKAGTLAADDAVEEMCRRGGTNPRPS